ncbi:2OG-Fe(II) oxygenase [Edaphocola flava]|jgi:Rps23 Pro-64 3,4-dihydroxylase Tpa1-like proline 4-hydroxylase|uniref:2OG-Fe(II) oxygenase n=1 Tax=Edaphocola flava TaxID=2499629 RepID=UPI00100A2723|nr:2OG-Fe(II) oxygenase [Edaphocola flava]
MTSPYTRVQLADMILKRLEQEKDQLEQHFKATDKIHSCTIDNLLPEEIALQIYKAFPTPEQMGEHRSIREYKKVAAQMNLYNPLLEEIIYAFQDERVVRIVEAITGIPDMRPDEHLYAGGISLMTKGNFLNPHLDNSHDNDRSLYRVLNLLYYVSPDWSLENGGNLELWDHGTEQQQRTIVSAFNRLALMITNKTSIHSVSKVTAEASRCCVSNYYFSPHSLEGGNYFHVTSFYGRPEEPVKKILLALDRKLRNLIRKLTGKRIVETKHIYKKDQ